MRRMKGWVRLALILSGLWVLGVCVYAGYGWTYAASVRSPFVSWFTVTTQGDSCGV